jgi:NNMT/PNMT/TEMT family
MTNITPPESLFYEFPARGYLEKYYGTMGPENVAFVRSITDYLCARTAPTDTVIEVAGGPSLYSLMSLMASRRRPFEHVTFTDIGWKNLREVESWLGDDPAQFDYAPLLRWLRDEAGIDAAQVTAALRASDWELTQFDWHNPVPQAWRHGYDVVSCHFFAESATSDEADLVEFLSHLAQLGRPGATLLTSFICHSSGYRIHESDFPAFAIDEASVFDYLDRAGVRLHDVEVRSVPAQDPGSDPGYEGLLFIAGRLPG